MHPGILKKKLRFYFITDDGATIPPVRQVEAAISGGATIVQYRNKSFCPDFFEEADTIRRLCRANSIPFVINDDPVLAKAVKADGVHLGQSDTSPATARMILGDAAIVGVSVSTPSELEKTDIGCCDYAGTGPVFDTATKKDSKPTIGVEGLKDMVRRVPLPVVAIGGVTHDNASMCLEAGAAGIAVISCVTRSADPFESACSLARVCGVNMPGKICLPWNDEFGLIDRLLARAAENKELHKALKIGAGDDAAVLNSLKAPVVTTDTQAQNVHFRLDWQTPVEVGRKAVAVTLSDMAASYAVPVAIFINLALPADMAESVALDLYSGIVDEASTYGCVVAGGNLYTGERLEINMFGIGEAMTGFYPSRSNVKPGDELYCTGCLGLARAGLLALREGRNDCEQAVLAFKFPRARFDAAKVLADCGVMSVTDISDGLAGDAGHLAAASGVTVCFDVDNSAYCSHLLDFCEKTGSSPDELFFSGGEDYELLFACPPETAELVKKSLPVYRLGKCVPYDGVYLRNTPPGAASFQHGAGS